MGQLSQQVCFYGVYMYYGYTPGNGYPGLSGGQVEILTTCEHVNMCTVIVILLTQRYYNCSKTSHHACLQSLSIRKFQYLLVQCVHTIKVLARPEASF